MKRSLTTRRLFLLPAAEGCYIKKVNLAFLRAVLGRAVKCDFKMVEGAILVCASLQKMHSAGQSQLMHLGRPVSRAQQRSHAKLSQPKSAGQARAVPFHTCLCGALPFAQAGCSAYAGKLHIPTKTLLPDSEPESVPEGSIKSHLQRLDQSCARARLVCRCGRSTLLLCQ